MKTKQLVECKSLGIMTTESISREIDQIMKSLPKEHQKLHRKSSVPDNTELVAGERADISLVSTESVDRDGDVVLAKGMDLTLFQRNPIVTMAHNYQELPVGKAQWVKRVSNGVRAKTVYASKPEGWEGNWLPDAVWSMTKEGILKGKSVGFLPTVVRSATAEEISRNPTWKSAAVIESCSLLEYAIAPIPVNQDALVEFVAKGSTSPDILKRLGFTVPEKKLITPEYLKSLNIKRINKVQTVSLAKVFAEEIGKLDFSQEGIEEKLRERYRA